MSGEDLTLEALSAQLKAATTKIAALETLMGNEGENGVAFVAGSATDVSVNTGDTAWILTSTCLVLMMTIPGLALFYGGMSRAQHLAHKGADEAASHLGRLALDQSPIGA